MKTLIALLFPLAVFAQTSALAPVPIQQPLGNGGQILIGGCLYIYAAGTTTKQDTWNNSDLAGGHKNTNPIVLDGSGRAPAIYQTVSIKMVLANKSLGTCPATPGTVLWSQDNVFDAGLLVKASLDTFIALLASANGAANIGYRPTGWDVTTNVGAVLNTLSIVPASTRYFVFDGDSRTAIDGDSTGVGTEWPTQMMAMNNFVGKGTEEDVAVSGNTCAQRVAAYTASVHPFAPAGSQVSYDFLECGINDIVAGSSAATIEGLLTTYWGLANADGFRMVAMTIFDDTALTLAQETVRTTVNAWILANSPLTNYKTIDIEAVIGPGGQWHNDAPHLTAQGQYLRAAYTNAIFNDISVSAAPVPASFFTLLSAYAGQTWNGPYGAIKTCFEDNAGGGGTGRFGCFDASGAVSFLLDGASAARFNKGVTIGGAPAGASTVFCDNVGARCIWYNSGAVAKTIVSADVASEFDQGVVVGGVSGGNNTMTLDTTSGSNPRIQQNNGAGTIKTLILSNGDSYIQGGKTAIIPPTSCVGWATGTLWNNSGTLALCP